VIFKELDASTHGAFGSAMLDSHAQHFSDRVLVYLTAQYLRANQLVLRLVEPVHRCQQILNYHHKELDSFTEFFGLFRLRLHENFQI
jgi:hypothetical protein